MNTHAVAQLLPQPAAIEIQHCLVTGAEGRGLWFDQYGDLSLTASWFYTHQGLQPIFVNKGGMCPEEQFPLPNPLPPNFPKFAGLDYDRIRGDLWAANYSLDKSVWKRDSAGNWADWFHVDSFYASGSGNAITFIDDREPRDWDGLSVAADGSLFISSDLGFNVFHVDPSVQGSPVKTPNSFVVPFPNSGIESDDTYLYFAAVRESRIYVYNRAGRFPIGFFAINDPQSTLTFHEGEDLDLHVEGASTLLTAHTADSNQFIQWDLSQPVDLLRDSDGDGVPDILDNCSNTPNANQMDSNADGTGDACQGLQDSDTDGVPDYKDNCPGMPNKNQADTDRDGIGDACDPVTLCLSAEEPYPIDMNVEGIALGDLDNDADSDLVLLHRKVYAFAFSNDLFDVHVVSIRWAGSHGTIGPFSNQVEYAVATNAVAGALVLGDFNGDGYLDIAVAHGSHTGNAPQVSAPAGVTLLLNDHNNHFGDLRHMDLPPGSGQPVGLLAIDVDGNGGLKELVVIGSVSSQTDTITATVIRNFDLIPGGYTPGVEPPISLHATDAPTHAIAMPLKTKYPEDTLAILTGGATVHMYQRISSTAPYFDVVGVSATLSADGWDLAAARLSTTPYYDLVVVNGSDTADVVSNRYPSLTVTQRQLTASSPGAGQLWHVTRFPSATAPDGVVVLQRETQNQSDPGVYASRFYGTHTTTSDLDVAGRADSLLSTTDPANAVMALGNVSRSCGRDLVVGDVTNTRPDRDAVGDLKLSYSRCPFDNGSRTFQREAPSVPNCGFIADVDGQNGADLIVGTDAGPDFSPDGAVLVYIQTPGQPNRFQLPAIGAPNEYYLPRIGGVGVHNASVKAMAPLKPGKPDFAMGFVVSGNLDPGLNGQYLQIVLRSGSGPYTSMPQVRITGTSVTTIYAIAVADFNGDGLPDVAALTDGVDNLGNPGLLFLALGQGSVGLLGTPTLLDDGGAAGPGYTGAGLAVTINPGTHLPDLVSMIYQDQSGNNAGVRLLQNIQATPGHFTVQQDLPLPQAANQTMPMSVATGTFPNARGPFIACADSANARVVVFVKSVVGYGQGVEYGLGTGTSPVAVAAADLEGDGDDELIVALQNADRVAVLANLSSGSFAPTMLLPSGTQPRFIAVGDVDGNGLPDILELGAFDALSHLRVIFSNCGGVVQP